MAFEFTDSNFEEAALKSGKVTVVDFWAQWCGPCRAIAPIIEELSNEYDDNVLIGKVDVDSNQQLAMEYSIRSIPTILIMKNGEVLEKHVGAITKPALQSMIDHQKKATQFLGRFFCLIFSGLTRFSVAILML